MKRLFKYEVPRLVSIIFVFRRVHLIRVQLYINFKCDTEKCADQIENEKVIEAK